MYSDYEHGSVVLWSGCVKVETLLCQVCAGSCSSSCVVWVVSASPFAWGTNLNTDAFWVTYFPVCVITNLWIYSYLAFIFSDLVPFQCHNILCESSDKTEFTLDCFQIIFTRLHSQFIPQVNPHIEWMVALSLRLIPMLMVVSLSHRLIPILVVDALSHRFIP